MRISDWSSDVCSSDLAAYWRNGSPPNSGPPANPRPQRQLRESVMKEPTAIGALITATRPSEQRECERHGPFISYRYSGDRQSSCPQCALEASIAESKALVAEREVERADRKSTRLNSSH